MPKFKTKAFKNYVAANSSTTTRSRYFDSIVAELRIVNNGTIEAKVLGSTFYDVQIRFDAQQVIFSGCTCPFDYGGICKHVVNVLYEADERVFDLLSHDTTPSALSYDDENRRFILKGTSWNTISTTLFQALAKGKRFDHYWGQNSWANGSYQYKQIDAIFRTADGMHSVQIAETDEDLWLSCDCDEPKKSLCTHLLWALEYRHTSMMDPVFNLNARKIALQKKAESMELSLPYEQLEDLFHFVSTGYKIHPVPRFNLVNPSSKDVVEHKAAILHRPELPWKAEAERRYLIVIEYSSYHRMFACYLVKSKVSKTGQLKSPILPVSFGDSKRFTETSEQMLFFQAAIYLQQQNEERSHNGENDEHETYKHFLRNPSGLQTFLFEDDGGKLTPHKLEPTEIRQVDILPVLSVKEQNDLFEITCKIRFDNRFISSKSIRLMGRFFFRYNQVFYFIHSSRAAALLGYFENNKDQIFIHASQFQAFKEDFLDAIEDECQIHYAYRRSALKKSPKLEQTDEEQKRLYLSESEQYIILTPAMRYGNREIPLLSKRTLYVELPNGEFEERPRNQWAESGFKRLLQDLHPTFEEDTPWDFYYLSRQEFLESGWFLDAFEQLKNHDVEVLGFSQLSKNRYNVNKAGISNHISSGIDWFDIHTTVRFGNQSVALQDLQKALRKEQNYVELGDGTMGILPAEWIQKFSHFFRSGEIKDDSLHIHRTNFQLIDDLFEEAELDSEVGYAIAEMRNSLKQFTEISSIQQPAKLQATLRDYQKEGLNWLHFLYEFGFGGILADDMGLGKTIQVISFLLSLHEKGQKEPNLIVAPTSLLFNWKTEINKFAPHLRILELYGSNRQTESHAFDAYDVIIITYGTLLYDVDILKDFRFNLLVLDESQAIKNPQSKRYKAVRLLQGKCKLALTGTPIENNTFDLYAQLSFANPGLLGHAKSFMELYATPIDKYQDSKRAAELQRKVNPFILRRTKKQVAKELPEKTEMIVYCEMGADQRRVYKAYQEEFMNRIKGKSEQELRKDATLILQGLTKLRQICDSPAILGDNEDYGTESAKLDELMLQIEDKMDQHKILVFSQFVSMLEQIKRQLDERNISHCYLTGETRNRQAEVDRFQNDEHTRVFLISLKAGGTGLNLTEADYVYIVDPWWNPAVENQAIDRAYRIGQEKHVVAIRLITPDSIEEKIMTLQERKRELADELIHTDQSIMKSLSKEDVLTLLG